MKKVVSVVTAPFRALGRLLLGLLRWVARLFGRIGRIGRKGSKASKDSNGSTVGNGGEVREGRIRRLGKLRGKARIVAYAVIAVVLVAAVVVLKPSKNEEEQVRETLEEYAKASRDKDYQKLCDDLLATELVERIRAAGLPCEVALRTGLEDRSNPTLTVRGVEVNGDQALAAVHGEATGEVPADTTYRLVREDGNWRIATPPGSDTGPAAP